MDSTNQESASSKRSLFRFVGLALCLIAGCIAFFTLSKAPSSGLMNGLVPSHLDQTFEVSDLQMSKVVEGSVRGSLNRERELAPKSTKAPSTKAPTATKAPSTKAPTSTKAPSTKAPTATKAPSTKAPTVPKSTKAAPTCRRC